MNGRRGHAEREEDDLGQGESASLRGVASELRTTSMLLIRRRRLPPVRRSECLQKSVIGVVCPQLAVT